MYQETRQVVDLVGPQGHHGSHSCYDISYLWHPNMFHPVGPTPSGLVQKFSKTILVKVIMRQI